MTVYNSPQKEPLPGKETASLNPSMPTQPTRLQEQKKSNLTSHHYSFKLEDKLIPTMSAIDLFLSDVKPIETLSFLGHPGFIFRNGSNLVAAYPKTGKTELVYDLAKEWVALGEIVLFLSEETRETWKARFLERKEAPPLNIGITTAIGFDRQAIEEVVQQTRASVIVIDTIRDLLGLENENDNSEVVRILKPLIVSARKNKKTIIFLHHTRKEGGTHGRGITGGHAFLGIVDAFLEISQQPGSENRRIVSGSARVIKTPKLIYEMRDGKMYPLGDPQESEIEVVKKRILGSLYTTWQTTAEVLEMLNPNPPSREQIRLSLESLAAAGQIERKPPFSEGSKKGVTYKWRITAKGGDEKIRK